MERPEVGWCACGAPFPIARRGRVPTQCVTCRKRTASDWHQSVRVPGESTAGADRAHARALNGQRARAESQRRRGVDPTTTEVEYTAADLEFQTAVDRYKRESHRPFPTLKELLEILVRLGYRKVAEPQGG